MGKDFIYKSVKTEQVFPLPWALLSIIIYVEIQGISRVFRMVELIPEQTMKSIKKRILIKLTSLVSLTWFILIHLHSTYRNLNLHSILDLSKFFFWSLLYAMIEWSQNKFSWKSKFNVLWGFFKKYRVVLLYMIMMFFFFFL